MYRWFLTDLYFYAWVGGFACAVIRFFMKSYKGKGVRDLFMIVFASYFTALTVVMICPDDAFFGRFDLFDWLNIPYWIDRLCFDPERWKVSWELTLNPAYLYAERTVIGAFVPFGFLVPFLWPKMKFKVPALGLYMMLASEMIQLTNGRVFDVNDIAVETLGVWIGAVIYMLLSLLLPKTAQIAARPDGSLAD